MGNFSKNVKKLGLQERLENRISQLEKFEARATMVLAIYDAMAGEIENALLQHVADELSKAQANSREDFYKVAKAVATVWLQEKEMESQSVRLESAPSAEQSSADSVDEPSLD